MRELQSGKKTRCARRFYFAICIKALSCPRLAATATKGNPASHHDCMNFRPADVRCLLRSCFVVRLSGAWSEPGILREAAVLIIT